MNQSCHDGDEQSQASCSHDKKASIDILFTSCLLGVAFLVLLKIVNPSWLSSLTWLQIMADTTLQMVAVMWWGVLLGALFIGLLSYIPREFIIAILGKGGTISGLLRATAAGVLLDLCSHGILMVGAKLYERGASAGQVIAFLLASPWNSFSLTLILIGLIGWQWTIAFILLSMVVALLTGWSFDQLVKRNILPANDNEVSISKDFQFWKEANHSFKQTEFSPRLILGVIVSGIKGSKMVVRWLLFGILIAAALRAFVSESTFHQFFGPSMIGLAMTVVIATVIEVCSEGATPIAADILTRAKAPGNSFAFLMAGVATDYTEIMVIKDTTRSWRLALALPLISVPQIVVIAWLINIAY